MQQIGRFGFGLFHQTLDESTSLDTTAILSKSRHNNRLGREYSDWVCSGTPPGLIETYCQQRLQQIRGSRIRQLLGPTSASQELYEDIDGEGTLSLRLFKGGLLVSIKPVSLLGQERLGWYRMANQREEWLSHKAVRLNWETALRLPSIFSRYEFDEVLGHHFKVGVNGEILGLWTSRGDVNFVRIDGQLDKTRVYLSRQM